MNHASGAAPAYGLWALVAINALFFVVFAFSFFRPSSKRDWRTLETFVAFVVALFVEMYGWPTLPTLVMFPILAVVYVRLARREEREAAARFGEAWTRYARATPGWVPRLRRATAVSDGAPT